eukprot:CAMPEP_0198271172 /NCGR_PEP_ID=MMETSP1447-20131203/48139_1 /TAXON_ID=420782 /ORGANISM="Chaetoceros dichaeta, Strain CCMP1751" /LENGTH=400 /DNA_ID=CAMNT_0043963607 /DNA_START=14 /DNA_END=1216 /DNA_ORIENTATION=+
MTSYYRYSYIVAAVLLLSKQYCYHYTTQKSFEELESTIDIIKSSNDGGIGGSSSSNVKIVAFTDYDYLPIAKWWYQRMTNLSYTTHTLILIDNEAVEYFETINRNGKENTTKSNEGNSKTQNQKQQIEQQEYNHYRTETMIVDPGKRRKNKTRSLWYNRILYCLDEMKAGRNLLLTDVDNVFSRYVDPDKEFLLSPIKYDAIFSLGMKFPNYVFNAQGFVVCGGMTFLRASPPTIAVLERLLVKCVGGEANRCDDQVEWNKMILGDMKWNISVGNTMENATERQKEQLMQLGFDGRSKTIPEFHAKVWDHDFAWRKEFITPVCPGIQNWVAMPDNLPHKFKAQIKTNTQQANGFQKLARVHSWEAFCGPNGTNREATKHMDVAMEEAFERVKNLYPDLFK